jgi:hypothetical protein
VALPGGFCGPGAKDADLPGIAFSPAIYEIIGSE